MKCRPLNYADIDCTQVILSTYTKDLSLSLSPAISCVAQINNMSGQNARYSQHRYFVICIYMGLKVNQINKTFLWSPSQREK